MSRCHSLAQHFVARWTGACHRYACAPSGRAAFFLGRLLRLAALGTARMPRLSAARRPLRMLAALLLSATQAVAWDASPAKTNVAVPSVEELARPPEKPASARES